jgi:hypothetical protein
MIRRILKNRKFQLATAALVVLAVFGWHYQSRLIGGVARWQLARIAAEEERTSALAQRRETITGIHRQLLIAPPSDALVPELYDLVTLLSERVATGEINLNWAAYVYTSHLRDVVGERPDGVPRLGMAALEDQVQQQVEFFYLRQRPDVDGYRFRDFVDEGESFTVEEIEEARRQGRDLTME